jgi:hypothetical protein
MKIVRREFVRELAVSAAVGWWNHWDHEHSMVVHGESWLDGHMLYEDERTAIAFVTIRVPIFSFLRSTAMNVNLKYDADTMYTLHLGLFGIPSITKIAVHEDRPDHIVHHTTYTFFLRGWRRLLAPLLPAMIARWNARVWEEDLPLKLRRQKMLRHGFRDFVGLPERVADRRYDGPLECRLPIRRLPDSPVNQGKRLLD